MAWSAVSPAFTRIPDGGVSTGVAPLTAVALDEEEADSSAVTDGMAIAAGIQHVMEMDNRMEALRTEYVAFRARANELGGVNLPLMIQVPTSPAMRQLERNLWRVVGTSRSVRPYRPRINCTHLRYPRA